MRFFSKLVLICNICFLAAAAFHYLKLFQTNSTTIQPLNFLKGTIVILAEFGWVLNIIFFLILLIFLAMRKPTRVSKAIIIINGIILIFQVYYFQLYSIVTGSV